MLRKYHQLVLGYIYRFSVWLNSHPALVIGCFALIYAIGFAIAIFESYSEGEAIPGKDIVAAIVLVAIGSPITYAMVRLVLNMTLAMNRYNPEEPKDI